MTEVSEKKPGPKPKVKSQVLVAVHSINGVIEPGTPFTGSAKDLKELLELGAARAPEGEAEEVLFEKLGDNVVSLDGGDIAAALG